MNEGLAGMLRNESMRIERQTLPERIAEQIRRLILLETLPPGASISEREMADLLGVSRTPLREALRSLANEGLIDMEPNRRPRVANPSLPEILHLLQVQGVLEGLAGEIACAEASDEQLSYIAALHERMVSISDSSDPLDFFNLDMAFHRKIVEASTNAPLAQTHATYNARLYRARFISSRRVVGRPNTLAQHGEIAAALKARDAERARAALRSHLASTGVNIAEARKEAARATEAPGR